MAALITACQPQSNIQTGLQTLKTTLPILEKASQDKAADDDVEWQETVIVSEDSSLDAFVAFIEKNQDIVVEHENTTLTTTGSPIIEAMELNSNETAQLAKPEAEVDLDSTTLVENNTFQIANLAEPKSEEVVESEFVTILELTPAETEIVAIQPAEKGMQEQIVVTEAPTTPDPIHPQTIIGQSLEDLNTSFGQPDFERSDANVVIWQYRLEACVTDFYMYLNGDDYIVREWAWRSPFINQMIDEESCQKQIGALIAPNV